MAVTYRAAQTIITANFTPQERARLGAAITLHHMAEIAEPDFEQVWLDNITAEEESEWDFFATICESERFGR
jgi:hypothetical protein